MKKMYLFMVASIVSLSLAAVPAHAETAVNNDVKVTTKNGKSTVCINGKCTTYEGDVEVKSENGKTSVKINNNKDENVTVSPTVVNKQKDELNKQLDKAKAKQQEIQEKVKRPFDFWNWIQSEIEAIRKQFPFLPI